MEAQETLNWGEGRAESSERCLQLPSRKSTHQEFLPLVPGRENKIKQMSHYKQYVDFSNTGHSLPAKIRNIGKRPAPQLPGEVGRLSCRRVRMKRRVVSLIPFLKLGSGKKIHSSQSWVSRVKYHFGDCSVPCPPLPQASDMIIVAEGFKLQPRRFKVL